MKTVYIIAGPTAVGKTGVAIALAQRLGTAIVSADSRQCYQGMAIGTAQPTAAELAAVSHYFIDVYPVTTALTAANYETLALGYLEEIFADHDNAVVCGGTGLYLKALCEGLDEMPETDPAIQATTEAAYNEHGMRWLQQAVQQEDPEFFAVGEVQNPARMLRALSFIRTTGKSILHYRTQQPKQRPWRTVKVALELPRVELYARINDRVDGMMANGLYDEVKALYEVRHLKNLQTVGYAELFDHIEGNCTLEEAVNKIKQHTRNYAKRQLTWLKKDVSYTWMDARASDIIGEILALT